MHPILQQIYAGRRLGSEADLDYRLVRLAAPDRLPGIETAVDILEAAVSANSRIVFVGDFDADGATSTALGVLALKAMGADQVGYLVPNRFEFGYGLSAEIVEVASALQPDLLITVDNGIASIAGVEAAAEFGISVIITDHHLPGDRLPGADAIVNPNLAGGTFPSTALAGVGVIFYVMAALRSRLRQVGWFQHRAEPNLADLLDLVALGTVADLVPLDANNRILVANGLERINSGRCRPGIRALLAYGKARAGEISAADLGFIAAPRLNAAGRLEDMSLGIECLLAETDEHAKQAAQRLDELNRQRRQIESEMNSQAMAIVDRLHLDGALPAGVCIYERSWHQGIVGLIASRVKDRVHRPVVAFADAGDGDELKGSARSIDGLHIRDVLNDIHTRHPGLVTRFGGHAAAAGLSLQRSSYAAFETAFDEEVMRHLGGAPQSGVIMSDGALSEEDICVELARLLKVSGPWGQGFPEPVFDDEFDVLQHRIVGEDHLKLKVRKKSRRKVFDAIAFHQARMQDALGAESRVRMVYRLDINEYRGARTPQLIVEYMALPSDQPVEAPEDPRAAGT